jgi:hypothetical protein
MAKHLSYILSLVFITCTSLISACTPPSQSTTPSATKPTSATVTPGYLREEGTLYLAVSYEYSDKWLRALDVDDTYKRERIELGIEGYSAVYIDSPRGSWHNYLEYIQWDIDSSKNEPEFQLLRQGKITLGNQEAEEAMYFFHRSPGAPPAVTVERDLLCRIIATEYNGRIFSVFLRIDTEHQNYEDIKPDFEHLLETFRFLN